MTVKVSEEKCHVHGARLWVDPATGSKYCPMQHPNVPASILTEEKDPELVEGVKQAPPGVYGKENSFLYVKDGRLMVNDAVRFASEFTIRREGAIRADMMDALAVAYKEIAIMHDLLEERTTVFGMLRGWVRRFSPLVGKGEAAKVAEGPSCSICGRIDAPNYIGLSDGSLACEPNCRPTAPTS